MKDYTFKVPQDIVFGVGSLKRLPELLEKSGSKKMMVVSDRGLEKLGVVQKVLDIVEAEGIETVSFLDILPNPTVDMVNAATKVYKESGATSIVALGGGSPMDVAKAVGVLARYGGSITEYEGAHLVPGPIEPIIAIPTTAGTGSEVTNISILELKSRHTKLGLAEPALFADAAVLIPELLQGLPFRFFATSSIDALIHAVESYLSPKANAFTRMYSTKAIHMILGGYKRIAAEGEEARMVDLKEFQLASTFAGIAFGNAGCAAVHAMSYPLGARYHVPHGESNYAIFTEVLKTYLRLAPEGRIQQLNAMLAEILACDKSAVYDELETLLNHLCPKKALHEYGVSQEELEDFTENVMTSQGRLMANNYTEIDRDEVRAIYERLY